MSRSLLTLFTTALAASLASGAELSSEDAAFFEKKVQPLLAQRCFECHSHEKKIKGGLALDSRAALQAGGDSGQTIVPGEPAKSLLIRAIEYGDDDYAMPPKGKLPVDEIATLREWVQRGAPDPRAGDVSEVARKGVDLEAGRKHWAFRALQSPQPPEVQDHAWPARDADRFVLRSLEDAKLRPAPETDPERLLRRLAYDLTGLPPSAADRATFLAAAGSDLQAAIEAATDRLLASPAFGEKWGRHWLDLARYADSNGSSFNPPFPMAWRYRNWVIAAHNSDLPYPQFVAKQLAGDLLPFASQEERDQNLIATGYLMLGSKVLGEFDKEQLTMDVVDEQVDTIGKSMLGLTLGCARCHDHKFDPVSQRDYYALAGILTSTVTLHDRLGGPKEDESDLSRRGLGAGGDERLRAFLGEHRYAWQKAGTKVYGGRKKIAELEAKLIEVSAQVATAAERADADAVEQRRKLEAELATARQEQEKWSRQLSDLEAKMPAYAEAVADAADPGDTALRIRGVPSSKGDVVPRGFLEVASWPGQPRVNPRQSGRLELARWIGAEQNPLTARVYVNRVWKHFFGEGLVRSMDNFGPRGDAPTHPELLDFLAQRFIAGGWRLKPLAREIVTSRAYRMSTRFSAEAAAIDPENKLLWRQNKRRLEPEEIRDTLLVVSGRLNPQPAESLIAHLPLKDLSGAEAAALENRDLRRTVYQPIIRTMEPDVLQTFDFAPTAMTSGERPKTTVAPQALYFMNAPFVHDSAQHFGRALMPVANEVNLAPLVREAFCRAVSRQPSPAELQLLAAYLGTQFEGPPGPTVHDVAKLCQAILASTQFQILD